MKKHTENSTNYECILCRSRQTDNNKKHSDIFKKQITYIQCKYCGLIYAPNAKKYDLKKIYTNNYFNKTDFGWENRTKWILKYIQLLNKAIHLKKYRICDFGVGNGYLTKRLVDGGFDVLAYEPYRQKTSFLNKKDYRNKPFETDVLLMVEVFEHFTDAINELEKIITDFRHPKLLIITTNLTDDAPHALVDWDYMNPDAGHFTLWSKKSLRLFGGRYGYKQTSLTESIHIFYKDLSIYETTKLEIVAWVLRLTNKLKKMRCSR